MEQPAPHRWRRALLRERGHEHARVTMLELFFDLVFVFAVTQLSHTLAADLTRGGALRTLFLFLAVWWSWIYTSWITNWLDPDRPPVRLLLFGLMLGGLIMSASLPAAFGSMGLVFGLVYAGTQIGRSLFMLPALYRIRPMHFRNFVRITIWTLVSGVFWVSGSILGGHQQIACWTTALAIEYVGPAVFFWVPGLGRSTMVEWDIDGAHLAERCALFVIIALGESILVTGATFADLPRTGDTIAGFLVEFLASVAMWWIYFDTGHERGAHRITHRDDPGRQGRIAYTYIHLLIVAGIIVEAVADERVLAHPGPADGRALAVVLGGPALYVIGNALFKWVTNDRRAPPLSHMVGVLLLAAAVPLARAAGLSTLALGAVATAILAVVATWETIALRLRPSRRPAVPVPE